jgi:hypothetical protein
MRADPPNTRLRGLLRAFPPQLLALPWIPPSRSWWPLSGPWAERSEAGTSLEKGLVFSLFRATPRSVAGLLSFAVEDWAARQRGWNNWGKLNRQAFLAAKSASAVMLFQLKHTLGIRSAPVRVFLV